MSKKTIICLWWLKDKNFKILIGTLSVKLEECKGNFSLEEPITPKDYTQTVYDSAYKKDVNVDMSYEYWDEFLPGPDPDGSFLDPDRLDGSDYKNIKVSNGNLPSVYLSFEVERS